MKNYLIIAGLFLNVMCVCTGDTRDNIIDFAKQYIGRPYRYAGDSPDGFDCSGFVCFVYRNSLGINLPHSSTGIWESGREVRIEDAKPGDIIVFANRGRIDHVALLINSSTMIHAVSDGSKTGVLISPLNDSYFGPRIVGVRSYIEKE
ncbi:hypothetical protein FACS1894172_06540 [Spirochaetia bacterium]|nr:hypothetical protein FACS1894164_11320 [Spirochaetia bacterium]GHU31512.1 hypothetical protein FACS1894172_06540 [Spirochaetia bacterium]